MFPFRWNRVSREIAERASPMRIVMTWRLIRRAYVPDGYRLAAARETGTTLNPALCLALCWVVASDAYWTMTVSTMPGWTVQ